MKKQLLLLSAAPAILACSPDAGDKPAANETSSPERPNFVFIFTDDMGYGDLGCFGAKDIATPHIDQMAEDGMRLTACYSASPVSSPSRAGLLTGRYPQRMGINGVFFANSWTGMSPSEITIAEMLKEEGYTSGIVGKWHLGHRKKYLPLQQGFDQYFGIPFSNDMTSVVYMRDNEVVDFHVDQTQTTRKYTEEALQFLETHQDDPFFLYLAHSMPHVPLYVSDKFKGTSDRGLYGDVIQEIDWSVGQVIDKLEALDLLENTLVVFSSDNGPWLAMKARGGSPGILREGKQYTFEGGMRVPTVAMWKGQIPAGSEYSELATLMDWFPTYARLAGGDMPKDRPIDGKDLTDVLLGNEERQPQELLYFNGDDLRAYRKGKWKVKKPFDGFEGRWWKKAVPAHDTLLFNLQKDPGEQNNLYTEMPEKARNMLKEMHAQKDSLGDLPPSLVLRTGADHKHREYLDSVKANE